VAVLPEIRELRYLVAVAEERRFTRAAERLYITQQSLSAAIGQLERRLGVELFVRDRQGLTLTPGGEVLLTAARAILAQAATAVDDTRRAAGAAPLRVGYAVLAASELTTPILTHLQAAEPQLEIRLRLADYDDPSAGLATATADVALVRRPIDGRYAFEDLFAEARVAVLPGTHSLARRSSVGVDELASDPVITDPGPDAVWRAFWTADDVRGRPPSHGVEVGSFDEELATVALGRAIAFTSAAAARLYPRPDVAYVPLAGAAPCTVALAWNPERPPTVLGSLLAAARRARGQARADGSFERYGWR
jgi:DNA-binding transcriptional LysR family regulator